MPLACGNTVVLKGSEKCPRIHALIGEALADAGLPDGRRQRRHQRAGGRAPRSSSALIAHPAVRRVNFTGSTAVGRIIAAKLRRHLKPVLLELGGKAPLLVLDDADLDEAVAAAALRRLHELRARSACRPSGSSSTTPSPTSSSSSSRRAPRALPVGDPRDGHDAARAAGRRRRGRAHRSALIDDAARQGRRARRRRQGGGHADRADACVDQVTPAMRIYREESFGPVGRRSFAVDDDDEAVRARQRHRVRPLGRGLQPRHRRAPGASRSGSRAGICHVNGPTVHDEAQMPFGGVKGSG